MYCAVLLIIIFLTKRVSLFILCAVIFVTKRVFIQCDYRLHGIVI